MKKLLSILFAILTVFSISAVGASASTSLEFNNMVDSSMGMIFDEENNVVYITESGWTDLSNRLIMKNGYKYTVELNKVNLENYIGTGARINFISKNGFEAQSFEVIVRGDLDGDSWCTDDDVSMIKNYINGDKNITLSYAQTRAADIVCNGKIDTKDATKMSNAAIQYNNIDFSKPYESQDAYRVYNIHISHSEVEIEPDADTKPTLLQKLIIFFDMIFTFLGIEKLSLLLKIL